MIKRTIANLSSRLLRASIDRICGDLELAWKIRSTMTSVAFIDTEMRDAQPCSTRDEVMKVAQEATSGRGIICEFGVYRGESINKLARLFHPELVHGFDTFTGLPEAWRPGFPKGKFDVSKEDLSFESNVVIHPGLFEHSIPVFLENNSGHLKFAHIDCDLYSSTATALTSLKDRITPGTILVFDEYFNYRGWQAHEHLAFQQFLKTSKLSCKFLAYNKHGQQVAAVITKCSE